MQNSNTKASFNVFALNNSDLNQSNTLDLHGLHVNEALKIFKQVFTKKKQEVANSKTLTNGGGGGGAPVLNQFKHKTYLFVVTGCGRHSEHYVARLNKKNFLFKLN